MGSMTTGLLSAVAAAADPDAVKIFGVTLVGISVTNGVKVLFSIALILVLMLLRKVARWVIRAVLGGEVADTRRFWARQGVSLASAVILVLGIVSIWVTADTNLATGIGLISAGLAFALQQVIVSLAAYFVILRGDMFGIGDRITLGGVRGDVVQLGFLKTTIMEMGQPPSVSSSDPAVWVNSRQYTGRLVTVTNGVIFTDPVYNYTRDFPYIWEEIVLPVDYDSDRARAEEILLAAAAEHAVVDDPAAEAAMASMRTRYALSDAPLQPQVFWRITDNWLEMSLRFLVEARGVRGVKDAMNRQILAALDAAGIGIASGTYNIVGLPEVRVISAPESPDDPGIASSRPTA